MAVDGQADGEGGPEARICHLNPDMLRAELTISSPSYSERDYMARVLISGPGPGDLEWQH